MEGQEIEFSQCFLCCQERNAEIQLDDCMTVSSLGSCKEMFCLKTGEDFASWKAYMCV